MHALDFYLAYPGFPLLRYGSQLNSAIWVGVNESTPPCRSIGHGDGPVCDDLVRGDRIVGIVDWQLARYYPRYWEYIKTFVPSRVANLLN